jgi:hypothetical protein
MRGQAPFAVDWITLRLSRPADLYYNRRDCRQARGHSHAVSGIPRWDKPPQFRDSVFPNGTRSPQYFRASRIVVREEPENGTQWDS